MHFKPILKLIQAGSVNALEVTGSSAFAGHVGINGGGVVHPLEVSGGHIQIDSNKNYIRGSILTLTFPISYYKNTGS